MRTTNYLKVVTTSYMTTVVTTIIGFFLTPFILNYINREEYGIFIVVLDIVTWLTIFDLGLTSVLNYESAKSNKNTNNLNEMFNTILFTQLFIGIIFLFLGLFVSDYLVNFIKTTNQVNIETFIYLFIIVAVIKFVGKVFTVILVSHQKAYLDNFIKIIAAIIRAVSTIILLWLGYSMFALAYASIIATLVGFCITVYFLFKNITIKISPKLFSLKLLHKYYLTGMWFFVNGIAGIGIETVNRLMSIKLLGGTDVTTLVLTGRLYLMVFMIVSVISNASRPMFGQLIGEENFDKVYNLFESLKRISIGITLLLCATIFAANDIFIDAWVGSINYGGVGLEIAIVWTLIIKSWLLPYRVLTSSAIYKIKQISIMRLINLIVYLVCAYVLGMKYGLIGIVVSFSISTIITSLWYIPYITSNYFSYRFLSKFLKESLLLIVYFIGLFMIAYLIRVYVFPDIDGFIGSFIKFLISFILGFIFVWIFIFDSIVKEKIYNIIYKIRR
jgi:O-antigen/teichoic acid export membrane protein